MRKLGHALGSEQLELDYSEVPDNVVPGPLPLTKGEESVTLDTMVSVSATVDGRLV